MRRESWAARRRRCARSPPPRRQQVHLVVDERYFNVKDLARLGLGRIAHEQGDYDDAYYHYFQIPDDSERLPEALFEAAWSMYQKREVGTARDLVAEMRASFPHVPLAPEAGLLAGYIELADCKFDQAQRHYDRLVAELTPVVAELAAIRPHPARRSALFDRALARWRADKDDPISATRRPRRRPTRARPARVNPEYVRLSRRGVLPAPRAGDAPHVVGGVAPPGRAHARHQGGRGGRERSAEAEAAARRPIRSGRVPPGRRRGARARRAAPRRQPRTISRADARPRTSAWPRCPRRSLRWRRNRAASESADEGLVGSQSGNLGRMWRPTWPRPPWERIGASGRRARSRRRRALAPRPRAAATATPGACSTRPGCKIDAIIGQNAPRDRGPCLSAGRFRPSCTAACGRRALIGDDEEYWPFEGEFLPTSTRWR